MTDDEFNLCAEEQAILTQLWSYYERKDPVGWVANSSGRGYYINTIWLEAEVVLEESTGKDGDIIYQLRGRDEFEMDGRAFRME